MDCIYCNSKDFKNQGAINKHLGTCIKYRNFVNSITKESLSDLYLVKNLTLHEIKDYYKLSHISLIYRLLKKYEIPTRSIKASCTDIKKKKYKDTCNKNFGFDHPLSRNSPVRKEMVTKMMKNEGITNVFQRDDVKVKILDTFIRKYGSLKDWQLKTRSNNGGRYYSAIHENVVDILKSNNIEFVIEFSIKGRRFSYDIFISNTNKIIEINGDYWHANPILYKSNDIILKRTSGEISAKDKWEYDKKKIKHATDNNFEVLVVWEHNIKNDYDDTRKIILEYCLKNND